MDNLMRKLPIGIQTFGRIIIFMWIKQHLYGVWLT